jgi:hypothetical protein
MKMNYLYNTKQRVNNNHNKINANKNLNQISSISNKRLLKFESISNISVNKNENTTKNMKKDCKYII